MRTSSLLPFLLLLAVGLPGCDEEEERPADTGSAEEEAGGGATGKTGKTGGTKEWGPIPEPSTYGSISGVVSFDGVAPAPKEFEAPAACHANHAGPILSEQLLVQAGKLKNVVVYVRRGLHPEMEFPTPKTTVVFDQTGCVFIPHVLAVRAGQEIRVTSHDIVAHNVHSKPVRNSGTNFTMPPKSERKIVYQRGEVGIPVDCGVHPFMQAYIAVFEHPYYAVTSSDGTFQLFDLPPGDYTIRAWHEKLGHKDLKVTLAPKGSAAADFTFQAE